jgi:hypothetical protein
MFCGFSECTVNCENVATPKLIYTSESLPQQQCLILTFEIDWSSDHVTEHKDASVMEAAVFLFVLFPNRVVAQDKFTPHVRNSVLLFNLSPFQFSPNIKMILMIVSSKIRV